MSSREIHARSEFAEQFEADLRFFQLLLLLINKSCPIKNVDLVWTDTEPELRAGLRRTTGTTQALQASYSNLLRCEGTNPSPRFCDLVSDHGNDLCCLRSDKAAEMRVHQTGRTEVYVCHAGLIDIAVPVLCDGRHIATLYSGQVVTSPHTHSGFVQIRKQRANARSNSARGSGSKRERPVRIPESETATQ